MRPYCKSTNNVNKLITKINNKIRALLGFVEGFGRRRSKRIRRGEIAGEEDGPQGGVQ
jgi:hypothetical protein